MDPRVRILLEHMRREADAAIMNTIGLSADIISEQPVVSRALAFSLVQIGEMAAQMPEDFRLCYPSIPWDEARGLRNRIVHGYRTTLPEILVKTVTDDLPLLIEQIDGLLKADPEP